MKLPVLPLLLMILALPVPAAAGEAPSLTLTVIESRPRQADSYTQGLFFHRGGLFESSGLYGRSALTRWDFKNDQAGERKQKVSLPDRYFAEGAVIAEGELYLLTWKEETCLVFDPASLEIKRVLPYKGEGWGLAWDGKLLWRSDGSACLHPHNPGDFSPAGPPVKVKTQGLEVRQLNELEWDPVTGLMLANVYGLDLAAAIDLSDGQVKFWLDGRPLRVLAENDGLAATGNSMDVVLNGLALDGDSLWLTGKLWPRLYKVIWPPKEIKEPAPGQ